MKHLKFSSNVSKNKVVVGGSGRYYGTSKLNSVRGMSDIHGEEALKRTFIVERARKLAHFYGFSEIQTPIVELSALYCRSLGSNSDIVSKEMYIFSDKSDNSISLRPEGTAGVLRAVFENQNIPKKLYYHGPMFRYERPQRGRNRQFHQFGVELLRDDTELADVTVIEMLNNLLATLQIQNFTLVINSLGDSESRASYRVELENYFKIYESDLSSISKQRLQRGSVLRILDSKEAQDAKLINDAPIITHHLTPSSRAKHELILSLLSTLEVPYVQEPRLVRGLDYYNDTCFEFLLDGHALAAGGRYDSLMETLGGKPMPGVGWAAGIERLSLALPDHLIPLNDRPTAVIPVSESEAHEWDQIRLTALKIAFRLKKEEFCIFFPSKRGTPKNALRLANKNACKFALFVGSEEVKTQTIVVKDLDTGTQHRTSLDKWIQQQKLQKHSVE